MNHKRYEDIPKEELQPMFDEIIGLALTRFRGFKHDSEGVSINEEAFYRVEKHIPSGHIVVTPTGKNAKKEFFNDMMNKSMHKTGKLN
jgi:hypothetical protein